MITRLLTALTLTLTTPVGIHTTGGGAPTASSSTTNTPNITESVRKQELPDAFDVMFHQQLGTRKVGSTKFWEAVSWCETNHKWDDGGYFAGGLGMAQSVWRNYGGWEFAKSPSKATKVQQMIVANRVAFLGFQTRSTFKNLEDRENNRPYFRPAVGWRNLKNWGRDCVNWRTRTPRSHKYTEKPIK